MKKNIFALFTDIDVADKAINEIHQNLGIETEEISYVYRDKDGNKVSGTADDVAGDTTKEGAAKGAKVGAAVGAGIGLVASIGVLGPLGAVVSAGPIATALGIGGAAGAVVTGGVAGAAAGGLIGALTSLGLDEEKARSYEERVKSGDVLVSIHAEDDEPISKILNEHDAEGIEIIEENM